MYLKLHEKPGKTIEDETLCPGREQDRHRDLSTSLQVVHLTSDLSNINTFIILLYKSLSYGKNMSREVTVTSDLWPQESNQFSQSLSQSGHLYQI